MTGQAIEDGQPQNVAGLPVFLPSNRRQASVIVRRDGLVRHAGWSSMLHTGRRAIVFLMLSAMCVACNLHRFAAGPTPVPTGPPPSRPSPDQATPHSEPAATVPGPGSELSTIAVQTTPSPACLNRASFVADLTVQDNTVIPAGAAFTKTWRLRNDGTCAWTSNYQVVFVGGDGMGGQHEIPLRVVVMPGERLDLDIDLTAPEHPGAYQGFWKLRAPGGEYFGVGASGDVAFWVKIVVPAAPTTTVTAEPAIQASGSALLPADSTFDLDQGILDPATGADIRFDSKITPRSLRPEAGVVLGMYAHPASPPTPADCQATTQAATPIPFLGPAAGTIVCYTTAAGRPGYLTITALDGSLGFTFTTWSS